MRTLLPYLIAALFIITHGQTAFSAEADGAVYYKLDGEIVNRELSLTVPSKGEGSVTLQGGDISLSTEDFFSFEKKGATVFYAVFHGRDSDGHFGGTMVLRGKYLRGSNMAVWSGDIYTSEEELPYNVEASMVKDSCDEGKFSYTGGFFFHSIIDQ